MVIKSLGLRSIAAAATLISSWHLHDTKQSAACQSTTIQTHAPAAQNSYSWIQRIWKTSQAQKDAKLRDAVQIKDTLATLQALQQGAQARNLCLTYSDKQYIQNILDRYFIEKFKYENDLKGAATLLRAGAQVTAQTTLGQTAMAVAILKQSREHIKVLQNSGFDMNATNLHFLRPSIPIQSSRSAKAMFVTPYEAGETPLIFALKNGLDEFALTLIELGCNPNHQDHTGKTALHIAAAYHDPMLTQKILDIVKTALHTQDNMGKTALHIAIEHDNVAVVSQLLKAGAHTNTPDLFEKTPLHYAAIQQNTHIVTFLLLNDANPNLQDFYKNTPLQKATTQCNSGSIQEMLASTLATESTVVKARKEAFHHCNESTKQLFHEYEKQHMQKSE